MVAKVDIKKSSRVRLTRNGFESQRIAIVSGVSGSAQQVLINAINDAQLPNIGDAHPEDSSVTVNTMDCEPLGGGRYKIVMNYFKDAGITETSADAEARLITGLAVEETHEDINGQPLDTRYTVAGGALSPRFTAEVERPRQTIYFEYTATGVPKSDIDKYLGKINSVAWNGYPIGSVLCSQIDVEQNGEKFRITYAFAYRPEGWKFRAKVPTHPNLITGIIDLGLDQATGIREYDVYRQADFSPLGFTLDNIGYPLVADSGVFVITGFDATLTVG